MFLCFSFFVFFLVNCSKDSDDPKNNTDDLELRNKIRQMIMIGFHGTELDDTLSIKKDIEEKNIGGVLLYSRNYTSDAQITQLISDMQNLDTISLIISVDQEGGRFTIFSDDSITQEHLGTINNPDTTAYWADLRASHLKDIGINLNLAPVVDLNVNPESPYIGLYGRSFSANSEIVIDNAEIVINSHHANDVNCALKHFPGFGSLRAENIVNGLPDISATWSPDELEPFRYLIDNDLCDAVMVSFVKNDSLDMQYPAFLSYQTVTELLINELGFNGLIISDDFQNSAIETNGYDMETSIKLAINAGVDVLLFPNHSINNENIADNVVNIIADLVKGGEITEEQIDDAYNKISAFKSGL